MGKFGYTSNMKADEKLLIAIMRISELYKKACHSVFGNYRLTFPQYTVLRVLEGSENGQNTITNASKVMLVSGANLTGVAKRLERIGFLIRKGDPNDERVTLLEITPKGRQTLKNIAKDKDNLIQRLLQDYSDDQISDLLMSLKKCLNRALKRQE